MRTDKHQRPTWYYDLFNYSGLSATQATTSSFKQLTFGQCLYAKKTSSATINSQKFLLTCFKTKFLYTNVSSLTNLSTSGQKQDGYITILKFPIYLQDGSVNNNYNFTLLRSLTKTNLKNFERGNCRK